ncbi:hypothetical protein IU483_24820 [Streptomyces gardneri]|nr:hypothetical protein [Streptomyces gardneri]
MIEDGHFRIALLSAWRDRCAWCRAQLALSDLAVDHVLPRSLAGVSLRQALELHRLPSTYDLEAAYNLVPACQRCNRFKSNGIPPDAPIISLFLKKTRDLASVIERRAERLKKKASIDQLLASLNELLNAEITEAALRRLGEESRVAESDLVEATAKSEAALRTLIEEARVAQPDIIEVTGAEVTLHHALAGIPGSWELVRQVGKAFVVTDDRGRGGYTAASPAYICWRCGSRGPWSGTRCLACGAEDPAD